MTYYIIGSTGKKRRLWHDEEFAAVCFLVHYTSVQGQHLIVHKTRRVVIAMCDNVSSVYAKEQYNCT